MLITSYLTSSKSIKDLRAIADSETTNSQKEQIKLLTTDTTNKSIKQTILSLKTELDTENIELNKKLEDVKNNLQYQMHSQSAKAIEDQIIEVKNKSKYILDFESKEMENQRIEDSKSAGD